MKRFEVLPHTADIGIVAYGSTPKELFEHAAYGMASLMFDVDHLPSPRSRPIVAAGETFEELLVGWLSEVLAVIELDEIAPVSFVVDRLEPGGVQGAASGVAIAEAELTGSPIKAVTWHDLVVVENPDLWWARVIFDT